MQSVRPNFEFFAWYSTRPSVGRLILNDINSCFGDKKLSTNVIKNGTMSDEEVASDVPPRYLFLMRPRISIREFVLPFVRPYVRPYVRHY